MFVGIFLKLMRSPTNVSLRDGGGHPLALRTGSRHGWSVYWRKGLELGHWSSRTNGQRRRKAWGKKVDPYPLIKAVNVKRPLPGLKICLLPRGRADGTVGLPKSSFM